MGCMVVGLDMVVDMNVDLAVDMTVDMVVDTVDAAGTTGESGCSGDC